MTFIEAQIIALNVRAQAVMVEVAAMQAHDGSAQGADTGPYAEDSYLKLSHELRTIHDEIQTIARSGAL